jgi:hypothetical protein
VTAAACTEAGVEIRLELTPTPIMSAITADGVSARWNASEVTKSRSAPGPMSLGAP